MISAARAQRSCPRCRHQLLTLVENTFAGARVDGLSSSLPLHPFRPVTHATARATYRAGSRSFFTTRPRFQNPDTDSVPPTIPSDNEPVDLPVSPTVEDIENLVRQARHAFGETLPKGYLNDEEYKIYLRLYGAPLRETRPEDVGVHVAPHAEQEAEYVYKSSDRVVLRETEDGQIEEVVYQAEEQVESFFSPDTMSETSVASPGDDIAQSPLLHEFPSEAGMSYINAVAKNKREYEALVRLQKDFEAASLRVQEEDIIEDDPVEEEEKDEEDEEDDDVDAPDAVFLPPGERHPAERVHAFSQLGHWRTEPTTLHLPKAEFVRPITDLLARTDIKHIKEAAQQAFGGPALPYSVATPATKRNAEQRPIPLQAGYHKMSPILADTFIATLHPGMYSSVMSILVEIRKRLGSDWLAKLLARGNGEGPRVLDVGAAGAGVAAWEQVLLAEWKATHTGQRNRDGCPPGKKTVVVGSDLLRQRVSRFLHDTTFLPRLPDYLHSGDHPDKLDGSEASLPRKQFDIIIASHMLMPLKEGFRRKALLDNLWEMLSPEGGVLIVLEKGHPRGFEAVAEARARLLNEFIVSPSSNPQPEASEAEPRRKREPGMIIAPCTNHAACPMYLTPGTTHGRKDFCRFSQRFIRPPFLQKIVEATHQNHDDVDFSFIAVQRGALPGTEKTEMRTQGSQLADQAFSGYETSTTAPDPLSLPRNILPPIKRRGHVTLDLCTPAGKLERWTVPKSFSKQAYHDARKARWGDLWALGAKTRVPRTVRLGRRGPVDDDSQVMAQRPATSHAAGGKSMRLQRKANKDRKATLTKEREDEEW